MRYLDPYSSGHRSDCRFLFELERHGEYSRTQGGTVRHEVRSPVPRSAAVVGRLAAQCPAVLLAYKHDGRADAGIQHRPGLAAVTCVPELAWIVAARWRGEPDVEDDPAERLT